MAKKQAVKHDNDKIMLALTPPRAMFEMGKAFTDGARKYGWFNYRAGGITTTKRCTACT